MLHFKQLHNIAFFLFFSIAAANAMEKDSLIRVQDSIAELFRIDEITVVARQEKDVMPPQLLKGEQMKALSTTSVADAVRYFSGVQIKDYGGVGSSGTFLQDPEHRADPCVCCADDRQPGGISG